MKILSLNIRHGGGTRVDAILEYLESHHFDVLVLSEFRHNRAGDKLKRFLSQKGFEFVSPETNEPKKNTVLVAAKSITQVDLPALPVPWSTIGARCGLLQVIGVYFPLKEAKKPLFDWFVANLRNMRNTVLIGDFNTGSNELDLQGKSKFYCSEEFIDLSQDKLVDAYRFLHPTNREYSWYSSVGNGFRIDHVLVTSDLLDCISEVRYEHTTRNVISDHSALCFEMYERTTA